MDYMLNEMVMMWQIFSDLEKPETARKKFGNRFNLSGEELDQTITKISEMIDENRDRKNFVISYMHYTGENYGKLESKEMWKVYCQADGYGYQRASELRKINGGWDWSHIRDSTIDGWKRMEKKLAQFGFSREM